MSDPRQAGGRYFNGYWQLEYTVTAVSERNGVPWFTCEWADGRTTTHCTAWDERRDKVLCEPEPMSRTCDDCGAGPGEECTWSCSSRWGFEASDSE